jgi:glycosyltransferase involved in cell wall biosynthesis
MKILFDYKIFYQQKYGGISNYFYNLAKEFIKLEQNFLFSTPIHKNEYIAKLNSNFIYGFKFKFLPHNLNFFFENFNHFFTQKKIKNFKPDIIHESYYSKKNSNNKTVCTVYDLINEKFPNYFSNSSIISKMKEETFKRVDHIICISENTKKDLIEFFNINEEKITVTLLATDYQETKNLKKKLKNKLLFVGSRRGYKNFEGLIKAYSISKFLKSNFQLIAYGGEKFNIEDKKILKKYNLNNNNVEFINDTTLDINYLYNNVAAFIFPSLYEGFGLPVLEAMRCGCPVILSNGGSLKEVGGDKLDYFDPQNVESIKYNIEKMLFSDDLQNKTIEYGFTRSKKFSWEKCAKETLQVYKRQL